ncbi:MAG: TonB-dependent receptor domain-containing protein [Pseudohongiellaceae bacterium]
MMSPTPPPSRSRVSIGTGALGRISTSLAPAMLIAVLLSPVAFAAEEQEIEEIVVVGTQIRGASISEALPVSVISELDIEALGVNSGDELLEFMVEQGQNYFSESENISGGVNSARGDIGAFNLRNLGTGNTLVLLNGRRMVNSAAYQTEEVGGSFVPVNTINSQAIAVTGLRNVEVLKDGASAIYGADAVAGVVNYVFRDDWEGFRFSIRGDTYENIPRKDKRATLEWGNSFNGGNSHVGVFLNYFARDRVNSQDDPRWADSDFRPRTPEPFNEGTIFRNNSANSNYGQYDICLLDPVDPMDPMATDPPLPSCLSDRGLDASDVIGALTDRSGEFETFPLGHEDCDYQINDEICGAVDGAGTYRYNLNTNRDLYSELERLNLYANFNHELENGTEAFGEFTWYWSDTNTTRHSSTKLGAVAKYRIPADHPYNPFGSGQGRLDDLFTAMGITVPGEGWAVEIDNYRWAQVPRIVDVDGSTWRLLGGLRGTSGDWDWETALTWSRATRHDVTSRISNTLLTQGLNLQTNFAINPFSPTYEGSNIRWAQVNVVRDNEQELAMMDFKMSNTDLFDMPAGPVAALVGIEYRSESFVDDRDPRLDGTVLFVDNSGNTFPYVSDVENSSPTSDSSGSRKVGSLFTELQIPVLENLDVQLALRYEDFSDVMSTTVGRIAFGYRPIQQLLVRGSWSQAFRAPNLITINEATVSRSNTRNDAACFLVDPEEDELDCRHSIQRTVQGSRTLTPETSDNYNFGMVIESDGFTFTVDYWGIVKEDTIGLFGEENHIVLDLLYRLQHGNTDCANVVGNPAVVRGVAPTEADVVALWEAANLCPAGEVQRVDDQYANLDERSIKGIDVGIYYELDTADMGEFSFRILNTELTEYEQEPGGAAVELLAAKASGALPDAVPVVGFASLKGIDGNPENKTSLRVSWNYEDFRVAVTGLRYDDFVQILSNDEAFPIASMTTWNMSMDYNFSMFNQDSRVRFGINNIADERAPLADDSFGYYADQHRDLGRYFYTDLRVRLF